ncbi:hypothetical protein TSUD_290640 [Trifolium subterraneum]|uniref:Uncharacterized protein n=1 Tax=Trifolium subterraneum TaxID=3900 RepID=A0A2Z6P1M8_TRISU|nr:hypothetical protein TSUD_290640 [Trifolium subterraneum]
MMTTTIPKACLNEIQKIQRAFIWEDANGNKKYHAMGWVIRSGEDALWIEVMKGKYDRENTNFEHVVAKAQDSTLWKSLVHTWHYFDGYEFWNIGKGNLVRAWTDNETSIEAMGIMVPESMQYLMVKDLVDDNGCWNFDLLRTWLPHNIISKMYALLPPQNDGDTDRRVCSGTDNGQFSIASAYKLVCNFSDNSREMEWLRIWKLKVPERITSFIWLVRHDRLLTNYRKSKMHIGEPWCTHCVDIVEDTLHVLRDCPLAKSVWCNLLNNAARENSFAAELKDWIHMNLQQDLGRNMHMEWYGVWATSCHSLWTWRNRETHDETRLRPIHPWRYILDCHLQYMAANVNNIALSTRQQMEVDIAWQQPEAGWVVLNTDGASKMDVAAGCGGLLRNSHGQWIGGFSRHLGICSAYLAELWGVLDGLRLARERGITKLKVQVDSRVVVQTLNSSNIGSTVGSMEIYSIDSSAVSIGLGD